MNKLVPLSAPVHLDAPHAKSSSSGDDSQPLQDLIAVFRRRYITLLLVALAVAAILAPIQLSAPKLYSATASLMFDGRESQVVRQDVVAPPPADAAAVNSEARVLASRRIAANVVDSLNLQNDPEFNYELAPPPTGLTAVIGSVRGFVRGLITSPEAARDGSSADEARRNAVIDAVMEGLDVRRVGETRVLEVSFTSRDPEKSAAIANAVVDEYLVAQIQSKFDATQRANSWLADRINVLERETAAAENAVEEYRAAAGLLSAEGSTLTEQQIAEFQTQLVLLRADLAERETRVSRMRSQLATGGGTEQLSEVLSEPTIQNLRQQEAEVTRRLAELRDNYGPEWPARQRAEAELLDIRAGIDLQVRRVIASIEQEADVARGRVAELEANISQLRSQMIGNNSAEVRLRELERTALASRTLLESFMARYKETGDQGSLATPDAQLVSAAAAPATHSSPITSLALALSILAGLFIGLLVIVVLELLEGGFRTANEFEDATGVRHFGFVPSVSAARPEPFTLRDPRPDPEHVKAMAPPVRWVWRMGHFVGRLLRFCMAWINAPHVQPGDYVLAKPLSRYAEAIRTLRASMLLASDEQPKTVLVTSSLPNEGKTTSTMSIARVSAMSGSRVIAVDCDTRHKGLTTASGLRPEKGLLEVLSGEVPLDAAILKDRTSSMDMLGLSPAGAPHEDVFAGESMRTLLATLRERYDLVLLDSAPVLLVAETRMLAGEVDAVLLVARWRRTPRQLVRSSVAALKSAKAQTIGGALSRVDMQAVRLYADGEIGAYYRAYNSYYVE